MGHTLGENMAAPITGPTHTVLQQTGDRQGSFKIEKFRYKQAKPYNLPAPYSFLENATTKLDWQVRAPVGGIVDGSNTTKSPGYHYTDVPGSPSAQHAPLNLLMAQTMDMARAKFVGQMNESAMLAVNFAERKQAIGMMANRVMQLYRFTKKLHNFDFLGAGAELGLSRHQVKDMVKRRNLRKTARSFGNNYLEFHFGWEPLVKDIYACVELVQSPMEHLVARGKKTTRQKRFDNVRPIQGIETHLYQGNHVNEVQCVCQAEFKVTNPNLYLANRLGLTNPASVAWELIPFSFVVDWFVNVSDFLNQWSEFHGVTLVNPFNSTKVTTYCSGLRIIWYPYWSESDKTLWSSFQVLSRLVCFERKLGIPAVTLKTRAPKPLSVVRGVTAISLLLQQLKG